MMREETAEACPGMVLRPGGRARVSCDFLAFVRQSTGEIVDTMTRAYLLGLLKSAGSRHFFDNADFFI